MERVILLNSDYNFLGTIDWKKAVTLVIKGKAEVVKATDKLIHNASKSVKMYLPKVLRLVQMVRRIYRSKVPYNKRNVIFRDGNTCQYCGETDTAMTIDHVIPASRGGKSSFDNCVASCKKCNSTKNDRLPSECGMTLKRRPFRPTIMEFITIKMKNHGIDKLLEDIWEY